MYGKVYLSRMIIPFSQVITSKVMEDLLKIGKPSKLKYFYSLVDILLANTIKNYFWHSMFKI